MRHESCSARQTCFLTRSARAALLALTLLLPLRSSAIDILVYNTNNAGAGSLRQAIQDNNALSGGHRIVFASTLTGTITLFSELDISRNVTILGPGADVLAVKAISVRVFNISGGTVALSGLTITRGQSGFGGGIYNAGTLSVSNCLITTNNGTLGGGIYNAGLLRLADCVFSWNSAYDGGAVYNLGNLAADRCAFVNGAVGHNGGALYLTNSTTSLTNCTIARNAATEGGGIYNQGVLSLTSCTVATNNATLAGGLYGSATVRNTIIAANGANNGPDSFDDVFGNCISEGFNIIGNTNASTGWGAVGDWGGTTGSPLDPYLYPLGHYGSPTPTMPPKPGGHATDQGKSFGVTSDQRGRTRPFDQPIFLNSPFGDGSDIGAAEVGPATLLVTTTNDAGPGSLRQTIFDASLADADIITFAPNVTNTITLTNGQLVLNKDMSIIGPGARALTVSGNNTSRVFNFAGGFINLSGLTIANGLATEGGGGIYVGGGSHSISECHIVSNRVTGFYSTGGGVLVTSNAILNLINSSLVQNQAGYAGGGVGGGFSASLMVGIYNCTIASNRVTDPNDGFLYFPRGGGLAAGAGSITVFGSTIAGNASTYYSGGIDNTSFTPGAVNLRSTIVFGNSALSIGADVGGLFSSGGYNLIGNPGGSVAFTNTGDQLNVNPLLGPLANYGGPTLTMALHLGSPAIDKGQAFGLATDQRGFARTWDDPLVPSASGGDGTDIGAYETDPRYRIVNLSRVGNDVGVGLLTMLGKNYRVEFAIDLDADFWPVFTNDIPGNGYVVWVTNFGGANQPRRFYRANKPVD